MQAWPRICLLPRGWGLSAAPGCSRARETHPVHEWSCRREDSRVEMPALEIMRGSVHSPFAPQDETRRDRAMAMSGDLQSLPPAGHKAVSGWGGRLWLWRAQARRSRVGAMVKRFLVKQNGDRTGSPGSSSSCSSHRVAARPHPGVQAAAFKAERRRSLKRLSSLSAEADSDASQMSEAPTEQAVGTLELDTLSDVASADVAGLSWEGACDSAWSEVTSRAGRDGISHPEHDGEHSAVKPRRKDLPTRSRCVAIDCEMVGVGKTKSRSILARVAVVDEHGVCLLDTHVRPTERITDFRTRWSGIRARDLVGAPTFDSVRHRVAQLVRGKILVGHAIHNDLNVLNISHPPALVRDTAFFPGLRRALAAVSDKYCCSQCPSLKNLCRHVLHLSIQEGEHCPVEDAAATMKLYMRYRNDWEEGLLLS